MIIFWMVAESLSKYSELIKDGKLGVPERPEQCLKCGGRGCFWAHGKYWREIEEDGRVEEIAIARFKCSRCGKTVSALPCFVIPRRRFAMKMVAEGIEGYATKRQSYKEGATRLGAERPSPAQLFCWVALVVEQVNELLQEVQAWCGSASVAEEELLSSEEAECPNAWKAQIPGKAELLSDLAKLISYGRALFKGGGSAVMLGLGMQFLEDVEQMQQIFAHRNLWKQTPQRIKP